MPANPPSETDRTGSPLDRFLRLFSDVRAGEGAIALALLLAIFVLLVCYYVLKTVREPLVLASAAADLQLVRGTSLPEWLKDVLIEQDGAQLKAVAAGLQAVVLAVYIPAYSWLASRVSRIRLLVGVSLFFAAWIELFFLLRLAGVPMLGFIFYIWVGIFSVSMVAQFWSFGNDVYSDEQGKRLFPVIGVGATAGAPVGSWGASAFYAYVAPPEDHATLDAFQTWLHGSGFDPSFILLQVPAAILLLFMGLMAWVARRIEDRRIEDRSTAEPSPAQVASKKRESVGGGPGGFALLRQSQYLRLIAAVILVLNLVNTSGEFLLSELVTRAAADAVANGEASDLGAWIGRFYGDYFLYVNVAALTLQLFVVSRLVRYTGLKLVLFALPLVALASYSLFFVGLGLYALRWAKTAENATDYSIMNTGKAMVWLPTTRDAKYQGKQAVDTFVVRIGDFAAALIFLAGTSAMHVGMQTLAGINLCLVVVWLLLTFLLLRRYDAVEADPSVDVATRPSAREGS